MWSRTCSQITLIAAVFSLSLGALLLFNSTRLYRGNGKIRLIDAHELLPIKTHLRENPKDEDLKDQIRNLDQQVRHEYFRREQLASRAGFLLLGGALVFLTSLKLACFLRRPAVPIPHIPTHPADPAGTATLAAKALSGTILALAGFIIALVATTGTRWQMDLSNLSKAPLAPAASGTPTSTDATWSPPPADVANNWPYFRGPNGSGITTLTGLPDIWDGASGKNVLWKSAIDLPGENSPVVWGQQVFLTGATAKRRELYCFDAATGTLLWKKPVNLPQSTAEPPEVMEDTGFAAPTAATDGRRVFAIFANGDIVGFSVDGTLLWGRSMQPPENTYGHAASLTLWQNRLIVVFDQADAKARKSKIMALDAATGNVVWTTPRPVANSWTSPIVINHQGKPQIITSADPWVIAYDPSNGKALWQAKCMRGDVATSPTYANGLVYVACDQTCIAAIHPDGNGDISDRKTAWQQEESGLPDMCSLLCDGPRIYTLVFGIFHAFNSLTGEHLWEFDTKARFQASPTLVNGRIHLLSTEGVTIIGEADQNGFKETGRAALGEGTGASPAFANNRIYLRGKKHLFCIGTKDGT